MQENDLVEKGAPLFVIDNRNYVIALEEAKAHRQEVIAQIKTTKARYRQKLNELMLARSDIDFADREFNRQSTLDSNRAVAKAQLDTAKHELDVSKHRLEIIESEKEQILASLEGDPEVEVELVAGYRLAQAEVEKAALNLERTVIKAPFTGRISKIPQLGKHVEPGTSVMSLIADENFWIEANLKETDLTHVSKGQHVAVEIDTYPDITFAGTVESISPATGSEYSIIPAQNATGNWVKVVQRIPVRVRVQLKDDGPVLRAGMSALVKIDTKFNRKLPAFVQSFLRMLGLADDAWAHQAER